jgi:hypothetical protein
MVVDSFDAAGENFDAAVPSAVAKADFVKAYGSGSRGHG